MYISVYFFKSRKNKNLKIYQDGISVIICVRNGENSIKTLIEDLKQQTYNKMLEFIIVDDESFDNTSEIILQEIKNDKRFKYFTTKGYKSDLKFKKRALHKGIKSSKFEWLLFTDVDCRLQRNWIKSMSLNFMDCDYVVGFSEIKISNANLVSRFQSLDFKMLMFAANSSINLDHPFASSGQNQAFKKTIFQQVGGYSKIKDLIQGDDSIFLQLCRKLNKIKVKFSTSNESFVIGKTHNKWKDFLIQRIRWAGDANIMWKFNKLFFIIILSTFVTNLYLLYLFFNIIYSDISLYVFSIIISIKFSLEFMLYLIGSIKFSLKTNFKSFLFWFIIQPFYIVIVGLLSYFTKYFTWRNRKII